MDGAEESGGQQDPMKSTKVLTASEPSVIWQQV